MTIFINHILQTIKCGGGQPYNIFGQLIESSCYDFFNTYNTPVKLDKKWSDLTNQDCQLIRQSYNLYSDKSGLLATYDHMSNKYLGTDGSSYGSWDKLRQCYTGGIFTGCKTSANHEVWERILQVTQLYFINNFNIKPQTWSWPGDFYSPFVFKKNGKTYYDQECKKLYNYSAKFKSSLYFNKERSWNDCLRQFGYKSSHDSFYPSRYDGESLRMMSIQYIYNAYLSRDDAVLYRTNSVVHYNDIPDAYPQEYFDNDSNKSKFTQMYEGGGIYYKFIEALRHNTANGMISGEVIDSFDTYSTEMFLRGILEYCKKAGIKVISKAEAYDICFNKKLLSGNLIYNRLLKNTAADFFADSETVPGNPDGYIGDCYVSEIDGKRTLHTNSETYYIHYGIPYGYIRYSASVKGTGRVSIYAIKNNTHVDYSDDNLELISEQDINETEYVDISKQFMVSDNDRTEFEYVCEGLGNKIMGIKIVYSGGLSVKDLYLGKE